LEKEKRCFGFDATIINAKHAEVISEGSRENKGRIIGDPRMLDAADPLTDNQEELLDQPRAYLHGRSKEQEINDAADITRSIDQQSITELLAEGD
jgi:hypothetical protein